jgi:RNA polymerase sigma-70 factor (ECF subfamily)
MNTLAKAGGARVGWPFRGTDRAARAKADGRFETIVLPHLEAAHNLARWLVRDAALAEDVAQDALVRALRYFDSHDGGDARAWLLKITRNVALDALAARAKQRAARPGTPVDDDAEGETALERIADPSDDPEAALSRRQDHAALAHAMAALPLELRECLVLRELEELSYKAIAEITHVPVGTVMSRLWRARRDLAAIVAGRMA